MLFRFHQHAVITDPRGKDFNDGWRAGPVRDKKARWNPAEQVMGEPHHILIPGYNTTTVNFLRLWRARATAEFDFRLFDIGDYASAVEAKVRSETISKVLYPCLLYTSDAADERFNVDLGGRRIIKKKKRRLTT